MTKQECAIIMAHTGICMLTGEEFNEFHKYVEYIMGRPVWTHELANEEVKNEIIENSKDDFLDLCKEAVTDGWVKCEDSFLKKESKFLCTMNILDMAITIACGQLMALAISMMVNGVAM